MEVILYGGFSLKMGIKRASTDQSRTPIAKQCYLLLSQPLLLSPSYKNRRRNVISAPVYFFLELVGRIAGEVSDNAVGIFQIEHLENGVGCLAVLALYNGVLDAHFLGGHVVLKHGLAM